MLLTVDVGNTNTVLGIFDDKEMVNPGALRPILAAQLMSYGCSTAH